MTHRFTLAALLGLGVGILGGLAMLPRVDVTGHSMTPTLLPGDRLAILPGRARPGRLVVVDDPRDPDRTLVKRLHQVVGDTLWVQGDNLEHSTDSRHFGAVPPSSVRGRPLYRYQPAARAGWVLWS